MRDERPRLPRGRGVASGDEEALDSGGGEGGGVGGDGSGAGGPEGAGSEGLPDADGDGSGADFLDDDEGEGRSGGVTALPPGVRTMSVTRPGPVLYQGPVLYREPVLYQESVFLPGTSAVPHYPPQLFGRPEREQ